jgi:hypothetical protein
MTKKKFYNAQVLPIFNGVRIDNGTNHFAVSTELQKEIQKPNPNIVMKLTNTNPRNERIKFSDIKKIKIIDNYGNN